MCLNSMLLVLFSDLSLFSAHIEKGSGNGTMNGSPPLAMRSILVPRRAKLRSEIGVPLSQLLGYFVIVSFSVKRL